MQVNCWEVTLQHCIFNPITMQSCSFLICLFLIDSFLMKGSLECLHEPPMNPN